MATDDQFQTEVTTSIYDGGRNRDQNNLSEFFSKSEYPGQHVDMKKPKVWQQQPWLRTLYNISPVSPGDQDSRPRSLALNDDFQRFREFPEKTQNSLQRYHMPSDGLNRSQDLKLDMDRDGRKDMDTDGRKDMERDVRKDMQYFDENKRPNVPRATKISNEYSQEREGLGKSRKYPARGNYLMDTTEQFPDHTRAIQAHENLEDNPETFDRQQHGYIPSWNNDYGNTNLRAKTTISRHLQ